MATTDKEIEAYTLEALADGRLLSEIAADLGIKRTTLYGRMLQSPDLADAYARAREAGLLARGEDLVLLARKDLPRLPSGGIDSAAVSQLKLEVETEKWTLSRLLARVFGDKVQIGGADDLPPIKTMSDAELLARVAALQRKVSGDPG